MIGITRHVAKRAFVAAGLALGLLLSAYSHGDDDSATAALQPDGPYVMRGSNGTWLARWVGGAAAPRVRQERAGVGRPVVVPAVGSLPEFTVWLRASAPLAADEVKLRAGTPLFVIADTHGEFEILAEMLSKHGVIDPQLKWSFGRGHLVFLGDVFDRGPNQTEILWLIYQLEAEAQKAGGGVHLLLGNHEAMVLRGDVRYLNPKYVRTAEVLGVGSYSDLFGRDSLLGQWLRTKPAILKINDLLFLHGGISRALVDRKLTLTDINMTVRAVLNGTVPEAADGKERADFVMKELGPLWYRGYFSEQKSFPTATSEDIDTIRIHFGVRAILVGHTMVPMVTPLYDGRVIAVQVYPHRDGKGQLVMEALRVENNRFLRARIDGTLKALDVKLPATPQAGVNPLSRGDVPGTVETQ